MIVYPTISTNNTIIAPNINNTPPSLSGTALNIAWKDKSTIRVQCVQDNHDYGYIIVRMSHKVGRKNTAAAKVKNIPNPNKSFIV